MDAEIIIPLISIIISLGVACLALYKRLFKKDSKEQSHEYLTPAALSGNSEWQTLLEDWQSLSKLGSWTPEYSRAEEAYRLKFREFLQTDLNQSNILHIPIVAVALQCTEVYIGHYHTRTGDLDWKKALTDSRNMIHIVYDSSLPEEIALTVRKIREVEKLVDDQGVDAAMKQLEKVKLELQAKYESTPTEQPEQPEE